MDAQWLRCQRVLGIKTPFVGSSLTLSRRVQSWNWQVAFTFIDLFERSRKNTAIWDRLELWFLGDATSLDFAQVFSFFLFGEAKFTCELRSNELGSNSLESRYSFADFLLLELQWLL